MSNTNQITREIEAFITHHKTLVAQYRGKYIAMLQGKVIDFDSDEDNLNELGFNWLERILSL